MALPETSHIALQQDGPFLHVTLNRPEVANAMSKQMVAEIFQVADAIADDRSVRAVILRGAGKHFSAGADLKDMVEARAQAEAEGAVAWQKFNQIGRAHV
jgi:isohexenylglutaconyl-CoA hydratase